MTHLRRDGATPRGTLVPRGVRARRALLLLAGMTAMLWAPASAMADPSVEITGVPSTANHPANITATYSVSGTEGDEKPVAQSWALDGSGLGTGTTQSINLDTPGTYVVTVTVTFQRTVQDPEDPNQPGVPQSHTEDRHAQASASIRVTNRNPAAGRIFGPSSQAYGETLEFMADGFSDPDGDRLSYAWEASDGWRSTGNPVSHSFPAGSWSLTVTASDPFGGSAFASKNITAAGAPVPPNNQPTARIIVVGPSPAGLNQAISFSASSSDVGKDNAGTLDAGDSLDYAWDLDNDGRYNDGTGVTATKAFPTAGAKTVRLRVTDSRGLRDTDTATVTVLTNQPPVASFTFAPNTPQVGDQVTFISTTTRGEDDISSIVWDLDNDGQFDDGAGGQVARSFTASGTYKVSLRATDAKGRTSDASQPVTVRALPGTPVTPGTPMTPTTPATPVTPTTPVTGTASSTSLLTPFPVVRIRGRTSGSGVIVSLLSVTAPQGATVKVLCKGRGCPRKKGVSAKKGVSYKQSVRKGRSGVRFKTLARKYYNGATIEIFITKKGKIGKYTRFRIRSRKAPARQDACLKPGSSKPTACPTG